MRFKTALSFLVLICSVCFGQDEKSTKMEEKKSNIILEPFGLIKQRKPVGDFMPDFKDEQDLLVAKIGSELYTIKPVNLVSLIKDISWMSSIPHWNAYISYYKNGIAVYTNQQYVLNIDIKHLDPKIFLKLTHHKEIIDNEDEYLAKRKNINETRPNAERYYFIEYPTNKYFLYFKAYVPVTLVEKPGFDLKLKNYYPGNDYYASDGKERFESSVKRKTINYNGCDYYVTLSTDEDKILGGYSANNESKYLLPVKIYCHLTVADCATRFDAEAMELFYGKKTDVYIDREQKNKEYILEWYKF